MNLGFRIAILDTWTTIGRILLVGEEFVIVRSDADPLVHNRERESSCYPAEGMLVYPIEIGPTTFIFDVRADMNIARVIWVGRNGGVLLPIQESEPPT